MSGSQNSPSHHSSIMGTSDVVSLHVTPPEAMLGSQESELTLSTDGSGGFGYDSTICYGGGYGGEVSTPVDTGALRRLTASLLAEDLTMSSMVSAPACSTDKAILPIQPVEKEEVNVSGSSSPFKRSGSLEGGSDSKRPKPSSAYGATPI